jgi:hypothetical protein
MDKLAAQSWFSSLSQQDKAVVLISVMHELTVVMRSVFYDYANNCETKSGVAYQISELNHHLTSAALALIQHRNTYPDAHLIDMLYERPNSPELEQYFPHVFERVMHYLIRQKTQHA